MLFNSFSFWLFYAVVFLLYFWLRRRGQNLLLLGASYYFYGCWDWRFLGLIALSTLIDYTLALGIDATECPGRRRGLLALSVAANLGILGFFKYYGFFAAEMDRMFTSLGIPALLPTVSVILPVGISFYTFQTMSYTIDVYRRDVRATRSLLDFAVYVSFFPQLVAGPIERAVTFLPQVTSDRVLTARHVRQGLFLIVSGMFRKVVIADNMAPIADAVFSTPAAQLSGLEVLLGVYAFAFQIYGDFSGYSSMARGVANLLGFDLMTNFRMPYFAVSPSDFWKRWHISLSEWLRDYLYIPLGGNRHGTRQTYRNLMMTMLLGGLWHGANWTFLAWGALHGGLLCAYRAVEQRAKRNVEGGAKTNSINLQPSTFNLQHLLQMVVMFHLVCLTWLLFRAESLEQAWLFAARLGGDFTVTPFAAMISGLLVFYVTPLMLFEAWLEWKQDLLCLLDVHWLVRGIAYLYMIGMILFFPPPVPSEFIYFQF